MKEPKIYMPTGGDQSLFNSPWCPSWAVCVAADTRNISVEALNAKSEMLYFLSEPTPFPQTFVDGMGRYFEHDVVPDHLTVIASRNIVTDMTETFAEMLFDGEPVEKIITILTAYETAFPGRVLKVSSEYGFDISLEK